MAIVVHVFCVCVCVCVRSYFINGFVAMLEDHAQLRRASLLWLTEHAGARKTERARAAQVNTYI